MGPASPPMGDQKLSAACQWGPSSAAVDHSAATTAIERRRRSDTATATVNVHYATPDRMGLAGGRHGSHCDEKARQTRSSTQSLKREPLLPLSLSCNHQRSRCVFVGFQTAGGVQKATTAGQPLERGRKRCFKSVGELA